MRILIVEDEIRIAKLLEKLIREVWGAKLTQLHHCQYLHAAKHFLMEHPIDLLFLDLNLKGENGFELLEEMLAQSFYTVIVSAYREEAIKAFEYGVLDFIPKPFNKARLEKTFQRLQSGLPTSMQGPSYLAAKKQGKVLLIPIKDILYIKADGHYTEVFQASGQKILSDKSLDKLQFLFQAQFIRIHRSYLVNRSQCKELLTFPGSKYQLLLKNEEVLPVGRSRIKDIRESLLID